MSIAIVTDSACIASKSEADKLGIHVLPVIIRIDGQEEFNYLETSPDSFYQKMSQAESMAQTSQPAIGAALEFYSELADSYDEILSIHVNSNFSGTFQTLKIAAEQFKEVPITVYDSKLVSVASNYLLIYAKKLADQGKSVNDIVASLDNFRQGIQAFVAINSLDHIVHSGRVSGIPTTVNHIFSFKAVVSLNQDGLRLTDKVRTSTQALDKVKSYADQLLKHSEEILQVDLIHGQKAELAQEWKKHLEMKYPHHQINIQQANHVIAVHTGPDLIGVVVSPIAVDGF